MAIFDAKMERKWWEFTPYSRVWPLGGHTASNGKLCVGEMVHPQFLGKL